ncbi:MAG: MarR family transcriptional regulator [Azonexus sp.]|jgi:DNA-binding MarR family transcriptional regulator|nr:MarR family transcriptional regulator [Azonexus sp.]
MAQKNFYSSETYAVGKSVAALMKQGVQAFHRTVDEKVADLGLTSLQWGPLVLLANGKASTAAQLSRCHNVDTSTMTRMLDRLENKKLITRQRNASDRRVVDIELTEEGHRLAQKIPHIITESLNQHLRGFSREEFDLFQTLLRRFAEGERKGD